MNVPVHDKNLFDGVNCQVDPNNMSDLERKHIPVIDAPDVVTKGQRFEATVEVGRNTDPPTATDHFIGFIDLYADETYLGRADFIGRAVLPKVVFSIVPRRPFRELRALAHCNQHGTWEGTRPIEFQA